MFSFRGRVRVAELIAIVMCWAITVGNGRAAENAFSNYLQGGYGDFGVAIAPEPGFYLRDDLFYFSGDVSATTADGSVNLAADGFALLNYVSAAWVGEKRVLGGRFAAGVYVPTNYVDVDVTQTSQLGVAEIGNDDLSLGDVVTIPASLYWSTGPLHINLYEAITAPTAGYDATKSVNAGRGYWSFDTVLALSWLDLKRGIEIAVAPGLMINTENSDTNYRTGTEFHIDVMFNKAVSRSVSLGLHGYHYQQLTGDSGSGAIFGSFKSRSTGLGPAFLWQPKAGASNSYLIAKWLHDIDAENRFKGDQVVVTFIKKL